MSEIEWTPEDVRIVEERAIHKVAEMRERIAELEAELDAEKRFRLECEKEARAAKEMIPQYAAERNMWERTALRARDNYQRVLSELRAERAKR